MASTFPTPYNRNRLAIQIILPWFSGDYAPAKGVTVGMKTILSARRVLVMAYGAHKTAAVRAMVEGPRTPASPASLLQGHPEVTLLLDEAAAGLRRTAP